MSYLIYHREFTKERTVNYLRKFFDIDISDVIDDEINIWANVDIYEKYLNKHPRKYYSEGRDYFNNYGRQYYLDFIQWCDHIPDKDFIMNMLSMDVVHHIHPLVYGGSNKLENLIHISEFNHELLHMNSFEEDEKYCHQAVAYLWYLYNPWISEKNKYLAENYDFNILKNHSPSSISYFEFMMKNEMQKFYNEIESNIDKP